jgi:glycosyltransferase involved in cell wall biosynthesis
MPAILRAAVSTVSVVISTFERPAACERAVVSALTQDPAPIEVLVCDDGSADSTAERMRSLERREPLVRYLRIEPNRGTPAPARNLGTREAQGEWIAFLDDDDEWLPGKLARQLQLADEADVIASNALTDDGEYFSDAQPVAQPERAELVAENPVIQSTALVRRDLLLAAGGFPEDRWLRGVEDYAAWLALADRGARFAILGEPLIRYTLHGAARLSGAPRRVERALARLAWGRVARRPTEALLWRAALNRTAAAVRRAN